jgi:hypothetical protein
VRGKKPGVPWHKHVPCMKAMQVLYCLGSRVS